jgi:hypothetical protein
MEQWLTRTQAFAVWRTLRYHYSTDCSREFGPFPTHLSRDTLARGTGAVD